MIGASRLGRISRNMMRASEAPERARGLRRTRCSRSDSTRPRTMRAMYVQLASAIRKMITPRPGWIVPADAAPDRAGGADARGRAAGSGSTARRRSGARAACRPSRGRSRRACRRSTPITVATRGAEDAHLERHARAVDHARHHVLAELVDAERVREARAERAAERVGQVGVLHATGPGRPSSLHDQRRGDRDDDQQRR